MWCFIMSYLISRKSLLCICLIHFDNSSKQKFRQAYNGMKITNNFIVYWFQFAYTHQPYTRWLILSEKWLFRRRKKWNKVSDKMFCQEPNCKNHRAKGNIEKHFYFYDIPIQIIWVQRNFNHPRWQCFNYSLWGKLVYWILLIKYA